MKNLILAVRERIYARDEKEIASLGRFVAVSIAVAISLVGVSLYLRCTC
jgi:hypothetical protein